MTSKGPRYRLDHETRSRRHKALEAPREPRRAKTHWDHVLEEMVWLSKDFESERKWKLAHAKKVSLRASKGMMDQATKGEKRVKEEEQRLRKIALNISKDMKKFWTKIEKLVLYKHQLELEAKKKKALDKQLEFLLGQTERYSTMLAENLVNHKPVEQVSVEAHENQLGHGGEDYLCQKISVETETCSDAYFPDSDYDISSVDEMEDDENTIDADEALITDEERKEELKALQMEVDLPIEDLLKNYVISEDNRQNSPKNDEDVDSLKSEEDEGIDMVANDNLEFSDADGGCIEIDDEVFVLKDDSSDIDHSSDMEGCLEMLNGSDGTSEGYDSECDFSGDQDDETTLSEQEKLERKESTSSFDEIALLQKESETPIEQIVTDYQKISCSDNTTECQSDHPTVLSKADMGSANGFMDLSVTEDLLHKNNEAEILPLSFSTAEQANCTEELNFMEGKEGESIIADAAAAARSAQPTGNTFSTTEVRTKFPFLLKFPLREYQHIGLDWLVAMHEKRLNGILADEMGLGKTIMTIALLAHLACEKGIWGPHLIVVPTSVLLNWETEFLKWCPAFKILTYFGSAKERKFKRQGWLKANSFHICITTYRLITQDSKVFKRKKWKYLVLDEAHLIKNWKSQRWQTLLNFNTKRRILLTGTPLQNDLMELWSLMHFLMPHIFQSHQEFKDWFCNPITGMVEGQERVNKEVVDRLHNVLRPFILRRLKRDVERQLPMKFEHVIYCRLSRRQRNLYEDFIASSETQATLMRANFFGMIGIIMQLRKVCNHPDLFESRSIISSFDMVGIDFEIIPLINSIISSSPFSSVNLRGLGFCFTHHDFSMTSWEHEEVDSIAPPVNLFKDGVCTDRLVESFPFLMSHEEQRFSESRIFRDFHNAILEERLKEAKEKAASVSWWNSLRCRAKPIYSTNLRESVVVRHPVHDIHLVNTDSSSFLKASSKLTDIILSPLDRFRKMIDQVEAFLFCIPAARAPPPFGWCRRSSSIIFRSSYMDECSEVMSPLFSPIRPASVRRQLYFPDRRLIQYDCGKLQELAILLRCLKSEGHRTLIFTQMAKMLDILEAFISLYGYTYMRLDGSTPPEERQTLMQRFNTNPKYFLFILSTRSGGVGINLVGADTVIFYDSDWNPAMDQQAQDRCHRIGQTREVHIYRLVSESTIEENILKKANQKRVLDDLVIQSGGYNTEFFKKLNPMELLSGHESLEHENKQKNKHEHDLTEVSVSNADMDAALKSVEDEVDYMALKRVEEEEAVDNQEFTEEVVGKFDDDECLEDELKADEPMDQPVKENVLILNGNNPNEEGIVALDGKDDADILADFKQMAEAAAAAGHEILSFEDQLRPIDRYAVRFLELWDPIVDKTTVVCEGSFGESDWELGHLEKMKEDMEANIDDEDEEPLVYENWDADFATEAYRQQVEALTQHQLKEEIENETRERDAEAVNSDTLTNTMFVSNAKSKRKSKKPKFKYLKKGPLTSRRKYLKFEEQKDSMFPDDEIVHYNKSVSGMILNRYCRRRKRRGRDSTPEAEGNTAKKPKISMGNVPQSCSFSDSENLAMDLSPKHVNRNWIGGKLTITAIPPKRVLVIKPERIKRKGIWSKDSFQFPDAWLSQEDAILCAVVHEYGSQWYMVSEILYGMAVGGSYRGRYRHPVHCCERFRELIQKHVLSPSEYIYNEKLGSVGPSKSVLKVSEENVQTLLDICADLPDDEFLVQRHFTALLSSLWKASVRYHGVNRLYNFTRRFQFFERLWNSNVTRVSQTNYGVKEKPSFFISAHISELLAAALSDAYANDGQCAGQCSNNVEEIFGDVPEQLQISLQFLEEQHDIETSFPSVIELTILSFPSPMVMLTKESPFIKKSSKITAENRLRAGAIAAASSEYGHSWASSAFLISDNRAPKSRQNLRKSAAGTGIDAGEPIPGSIENAEFVVDTTGFDVGDFDLQLEMVEIEDHDRLYYSPAFFSDLDDYSSLPEYTDFG